MQAVLLKSAVEKMRHACTCCTKHDCSFKCCSNCCWLADTHGCTPQCVAPWFHTRLWCVLLLHGAIRCIITIRGKRLIGRGLLKWLLVSRGGLRKVRAHGLFRDVRLVGSDNGFLLRMEQSHSVLRLLQLQQLLLGTSAPGQGGKQQMSVWRGRDAG